MRQTSLMTCLKVSTILDLQFAWPVFKLSSQGYNNLSGSQPSFSHLIQNSPSLHHTKLPSSLPPSLHSFSLSHKHTTGNPPPTFSPCQLPSTISLLHHLIIESKFYTRRLWALSEMAALSPATLPAAAVSCSSSLNSSMRKKSGVACIEGLNSFGALKAHNGVSNLGLPACTAQSFAMVVSSLKSSSQRKKGKGGALSSTCNAASEIFKIAAIVNGLVLIGVAVGFVILRVEATLEEEE